MYLGQVVELCDAEGIYEEPLHPYTQALLSAIPPTSPFEEKHTIALTGDIPSPIGDMKGCPARVEVPALHGALQDGTSGFGRGAAWAQSGLLPVRIIDRHIRQPFLFKVRAVFEGGRMEPVEERFLRYVRMTQSCAGKEAIPSTACQWDLANMLVEELRALGVEDASVDEHCYVMGHIPANLPRRHYCSGNRFHLPWTPQPRRAARA